MIFNTEEKQAIRKFSKLPLSKLRTYQVINEIQTKLAAQLPTDTALIRCQGMTDIFAAAIALKCFGIEL